MKNRTIKNVPTSLYERLEARPVLDGRYPAGGRLADLPAVLASLPSLDEDDALRFAEELAEAREAADALPPTDPWAY